MGTGQGGVPAKAHFSAWREPPQVEVMVPVDKKSGFREVVFSSNGLEDIVGKPFLKRDYSSGVAVENGFCESIHLVEV